MSDLLVLEFVAFDSPMEIIVFPLIHHSQILCDTKYPILFVKSLQKSHSLFFYCFSMADTNRIILLQSTNFNKKLVASI